MQYFTLVYKSELAHDKQAYIWFNRQAHHLNDNTISAPQAEYQTDSEARLLAQVQQEYPQAQVFSDTAHPGDYRCIKAG